MVGEDGIKMCPFNSCINVIPFVCILFFGLIALVRILRTLNIPNFNGNIPRFHLTMVLMACLKKKERKKKCLHRIKKMS